VSKKCLFMANYAHLIRDHAQPLFGSGTAYGLALEAEEELF